MKIKENTKELLVNAITFLIVILVSISFYMLLNYYFFRFDYSYGFADGLLMCAKLN